MSSLGKESLEPIFCSGRSAAELIRTGRQRTLNCLSCLWPICEGFQVTTAVQMEFPTFWNMSPCRLVNRDFSEEYISISHNKIFSVDYSIFLEQTKNEGNMLFLNTGMYVYIYIYIYIHQNLQDQSLFNKLLTTATSDVRKSAFKESDGYIPHLELNHIHRIPYTGK